MSDAFEARGDASPATSPEQQAPEAPEMAATPVDASAFAELGLAPELVAAVADLGYSQPTAVQARVMPLAIKAEGAERYADLDTEDGSFYREAYQGYFGFDRAELAEKAHQAGFEDVRFDDVLTIQKERGGRVRDYPMFLMQIGRAHV